MKFFSTLKAERCLTQLMSAPDSGSADARQALENLRSIGSSAIPKVIDAFATADKGHNGALVTLLASLLDDKSFSFYAEGLAHPNKLCVAGVTKALAISGGYDANQLLELLGKEQVSTGALIEILGVVRKRLNARELLKRAYELEPREKAAVFKIIGDIAKADIVPELVARLEGKDPSVRLNIIELLSRFNQPEVAQALERQLKDKNKMVRKAALEALAAMPGERDIRLICALLADPELEVQARAVDLVVKLRHPDTMQHLLTVLKDESEFARRSAVEVLNEIAEPETIKYLLVALEDGDWWGPVPGLGRPGEDWRPQGHGRSAATGR